MTYINVNEIEQMIADGRIKRIFLDYDCTMVDSITAVLSQLNERYETSYIASDCTTWNFHNLYPILSEIDLLEIFDSVRFFEEVKMYDGVSDFINRHFDMITVVSKGLETNLYLKSKWLNKHFPSIDFVGLEGTNMDKSMVKMGRNSLHIDDNQDNLKSTDAEYKIMFVNVENAEWNDKWTVEQGRYAIRRDGYWEKRFKMDGWKLI